MLEIRAVVPEILLLVRFWKSAPVKFVPALIRLYANVAPAKMADDIFTLSRIQLMMLAFVNTTPDKIVPDKS